MISYFFLSSRYISIFILSSSTSFLRTSPSMRSFSFYNFFILFSNSVIFAFKLALSISNFSVSYFKIWASFFPVKFGWLLNKLGEAENLGWAIDLFLF